MGKSKSTDVALVNEGKLQALREASGSKEGGTFWPPKIKINRSPLDKQDNPLPMGKYVLVVNDVQHFFSEVHMIVMERGTQFMRFSGKGDYLGCTMIENKSKPEYKDVNGGTRLGRVSGMAYDEMTTAQKEVGFYYHMLGVIDLSSAVDAAGKALYKTTEPMYSPVSLQFKGKKSVTKQDEFRKLKKSKEAYFDFVTKLAKPYRAGDIDGIPYYDFNFERGDDVQLTSELLDSIEASKELVENENRRIYGLYLKAQQGTVNSDEGSYTDLELPDEED